MQQVSPPKKPRAAIQRRTADAIPSFEKLPESGLVRASELIRDPRHPERATPLPFSKATLWRKVRDGIFPKPIQFSRGLTAWKVGDVRAWLAQQGQEGGQ